MNDSHDVTRLLLVEDNRGDAVTVMDMLKLSNRESYDVTHVSRLSEAEQQLSSGTYDILLVDLQLPDSHGVHTVRKMSAAASRLPMVVLTSHESQRVAAACMDAGACGVLTKSALADEALWRALREARLGRANYQLGRPSRPLRQIALRLYVAGSGPLSQRAIANLNDLCETALAGRFSVEVIDVLKQPALAEREHILATPVLVQHRSGTPRHLIGDLGDRERVLAALGMHTEDQLGVS